MVENAGAALVVFFGLGYSARVLAARLVGEGWEVRGTARDPEAASPPPAGCRMYRFDRAHGLPPAAFAGVTHVLVSIPPDAEGDPVIDSHAEDIAAIPGLAWLGYLSTTGVYGDRGGSGSMRSRSCARAASAAGGASRRRPDGSIYGGAILCRCMSSGSPRSTDPAAARFGAARRHRETHRQEGPGLLAHPCRGSRERAGRLDRAAASRRGL